MQGRPSRTQAGRRLRALRNGLISLTIGTLMALALLAYADQARRQGDLQMARDSYRMLWSPALFGVAGVLFLLHSLGPPYRLPRGWPLAGPAPRQPAAPEPPPGPPPPAAPAAAPDRYLQACRELGVPPGSDWVLVRATWRRRLQEWHPDNGGDADLWIRKQSAYALLEAWEQFRP